MNQKLSAVIITFNEERNIERCLNSLSGIADEIIVVDSFSTDKTKEICKKYDLTFFEKKWEGYGEQKNFANQQTKYPYVISLDADEAISQKLKESILKVKSQGFKGAFSFNRLTNYCGDWVHHTSWYPDTKTRIFNKNEVHWEGDIHENLIIKAKVIHLKGDLFHYSFYTKKEHYDQIKKYTTLSANQLFAKGKKSNYFLLLIKPLARFLKNYFIKRGFLDGKVGFTISKMSAYSNFMRYKKLLKLQNGKKID